MSVQKGGFHQRISFETKDGIQTFDELGDGIRTIVRTRDNLYRRAVICKLDQKKRIYKIQFRRGVYANTDTIIYAAGDQEWLITGRGAKETKDLKRGYELYKTEDVAPAWEVISVEPSEEECDVWSVKVTDGESFMLRNAIPTMSYKEEV